MLSLKAPFLLKEDEAPFLSFPNQQRQKVKGWKMSAHWQWFWFPPPVLFSRIRHWETCERAAARENNLHTINASRRKAAADDTDKVSATTSPHFLLSLSFFFFFVLDVLTCCRPSRTTLHLRASSLSGPDAAFPSCPLDSAGKSISPRTSWPH